MCMFIFISVKFLVKSCFGNISKMFINPLRPSKVNLTYEVLRMDFFPAPNTNNNHG